MRDRLPLTAEHFFKFCKEEIKGIHLFFMDRQGMEELRTDLETRFETSHTLPGTRGFHHFAPMSEAIIPSKEYQRRRNSACIIIWFLEKNPEHSS